MSEKKLKLMNALKAKNKLTEEEEELLQELESEFIGSDRWSVPRWPGIPALGVWP